MSGIALLVGVGIGSIAGFMIGRVIGWQCGYNKCDREWEETMGILSSPENVNGIAQAEEDMRQGRMHTHKEVWRKKK